MLGMTRRMAYRCSVCESSVCERSVFVSYFVRWGKKDPSPSGYDGGCARCASLGRDNLKWQLLASSAARQGWVSQSKCQTRARTAQNRVATAENASEMLEIARKSLEIARRGS